MRSRAQVLSCLTPVGTIRERAVIAAILLTLAEVRCEKTVTLASATLPCRRPGLFRIHRPNPTGIRPPDTLLHPRLIEDNGQAYRAANQALSWRSGSASILALGVDRATGSGKLRKCHALWSTFSFGALPRESFDSFRIDNGCPPEGNSDPLCRSQKLGTRPIIAQRQAGEIARISVLGAQSNGIDGFSEFAFEKPLEASYREGIKESLFRWHANQPLTSMNIRSPKSFIWAHASSVCHAQVQMSWSNAGSGINLTGLEKIPTQRDPALDFPLRPLRHCVEDFLTELMGGPVNPIR